MNKHRNKGFTLIEVLVVLAIIAIMSAILFMNYGTVDDNLLLNRAVDQTTIAIRKAQVQSLAVTESALTPSDFNVSYGVYADESTPSSILYFRNSSDVLGYVDGTSSVVETITFDGGVEVSRVRCGGSDCAGDAASVMYNRPRPEAIMRDGNRDSVSSIEIVLISPLGSEKIVRVEAGGAVSVE